MTTKKYQKGGKPICASHADSQSCSSPKASCVCCRLIYSSLQLECIGRLGRTLIQTTGSCLLRTCSESSGVRMMVAARLRPGPLCSSGDSEISVCTVGGAESPSGNRSSLHQSCAAFTKPPVPKHSLRWIESPKLGSSIQRVVTGHFRDPSLASGVS